MMSSPHGASSTLSSSLDSCARSTCEHRVPGLQELHLLCNLVHLDQVKSFGFQIADYFGILVVLKIFPWAKKSRAQVEKLYLR